MKSATVQINQLRLRVPGLTQEQARRLGEVVAKRLTELPLDTNHSRQIPALVLRVRSGPTSSMERMANDITNRIRHGLG